MAQDPAGDVADYLRGWIERTSTEMAREAVSGMSRDGRRRLAAAGGHSSRIHLGRGGCLGVRVSASS
jgi:hypothetical protein